MRVLQENLALECSTPEAAPFLLAQIRYNHEEADRTVRTESLLKAFIPPSHFGQYLDVPIVRSLSRVVREYLSKVEGAARR